MTNVFSSLMSGGYEPDIDDTPASDFDLWLEEKQNAAQKMSLNELYLARFEAQMDNDNVLADMYDTEIDKRNPAITITGYGSLQDEPYQDDPEHEDRRKDYLENYAADDMGDTDGDTYSVWDDPERFDAMYEAWESSWIDGPQP